MDARLACFGDELQRAFDGWLDFGRVLYGFAYPEGLHSVRKSLGPENAHFNPAVILTNPPT
jgi:hypothetical protein